MMPRAYQLYLISALILSPVLSLKAAHSDSPDDGRAWSTQRVDAHAPIGVMGDHTHRTGEVMLSYRFMQMRMDGLRSGNRRISPADVLSNYMVAPLKMDMDMHMLGAMYAPEEWLTLMLMLPYTEMSMDHQTRMGQSFTTSGSGIDDLSLTGLIRLVDTGSHRVHLNAGLSLPAGDINVRDDTPAMANARLPYPMQIGSGTYDLLPGITYAGQVERFSLGAQLLGRVHLGENSNGYTMGNRLESSIWGAVPLQTWLSCSLRLAYQISGRIDGNDSVLNPLMVSTADTTNSGGERLETGIGINFLLPDGPLDSARLATELLIPIYQELNGQQLETDISWITGLQLAF